MLRTAVAFTLCLSLVGSLKADTPAAIYIFPAGAQRGTTVRVNVGGFYLHQICSFEMLGSGVKAPQNLIRAKKTVWFEGPLIPMPASQATENYPKDQTGKLTIEPNARLGMRRWRVWTPQGVTPTKVFVIGNLPEVVEKEVDGRPIPTSVTLPVTINGRIFPREDVDIWTFEGRKGHSYACEVMAARIGSPLDSHLEIRGPDGRRVAENTDGVGSDSRLRFVAPANGTYQVRIHDVNYRGLQQYVYRLTITNGPYIQSVYPLGARRGSTTKFEVVGQNVPANRVTVKLPKQCKQTYLHSAKFGNTPSNLFAIEASDLPEHLESEPNQKPASKPLDLPAALNGRIDQAGDVDTWLVRGKKGETFQFDLMANRLGSPLDTSLIIETQRGKRIAISEDISAQQPDSRISYKFKSDQPVVVRIKSGQQVGGGKSFSYRLIADRTPLAKPGFKLQLPMNALTLNIGGTSKLAVNVQRTSYAAEIPLIVKNLPPGVTVTGTKIPKGKNKAQLVFKATKKIGVSTAKIQILGELKVAGKKTLMTAVSPAVSPMDNAVDHVLLGVSLPTPWKVVGIFQTRYAARGSTYFRKLTLKRGDYKGPLVVKLSDTQARHLQGVTGPTLKIPAGKSDIDFVYPIKLAPWMEIGRTSRTALMAIGTVKDPKGKSHVVSFTSLLQNEQIVVLVDPGQLTVDCQKRSFLAKSGGQVSFKVRIGRGGPLKGLPCKIELVVPDHVRGVQSQPVKLAGKLRDAVLKVQFGGKVGPFNLPLIVRATAMIDGHPYTAEQKIDFRTED